MSPYRWDDDPLLNAMFLNAKKIIEFLGYGKDLKHLLEQTDASEVFALLTAARREKTIFGAEENGEIIRRDVRQKMVSFEDHKMLGISADLAETRLQIRHWLLAGLFEQAFQEITHLKNWTEELNEQHDLLEFKLRHPNDSVPRTGMDSSSETDKEVNEAQKVHNAIEMKLDEIKNKLDSPEDYFNILTRVLLNPEEHLSLKPIDLKLSRLGIQLDAASTEPSNEFTLAEFELGPSMKSTAVWVRVNRTSALTLPG